MTITFNMIREVINRNIDEDEAENIVIEKVKDEARAAIRPVFFDIVAANLKEGYLLDEEQSQLYFLWGIHLTAELYKPDGKWVKIHGYVDYDIAKDSAYGAVNGIIEIRKSNGCESKRVVY